MCFSCRRTVWRFGFCFDFLVLKKKLSPLFGMPSSLCFVVASFQFPACSGHKPEGCKRPRPRFRIFLRKCELVLYFGEGEGGCMCLQVSPWIEVLAIVGRIEYLFNLESKKKRNRQTRQQLSSIQQYHTTKTFTGNAGQRVRRAVVHQPGFHHGGLLRPRVGGGAELHPAGCAGRQVRHVCVRASRGPGGGVQERVQQSPRMRCHGEDLDLI